MIPSDFVYLSTFCPTILIGANYATRENFTGDIVEGYRRKEVIFSRVGAEALSQVQAEALKLGFRLKVFDAYRPVKAVQSFQKWALCPDKDPTLKQRYYPDHDKADLFELGYIARQSVHSRGSAVDLTLVDAQGEELDMGTIFDFFHKRSHTESPDINAEHRKNRQLLLSLMSAHGFKNYRGEWWHFSLINEAFPGQFFDFNVE